MLDETQKIELWRTLRRLDRREKREVIDRLRRSLGEPASTHRDQVESADDAPVSGDGKRSAFDAAQAAGIIGAISEGPADVSTNPRYMEGFGRE